MLVIYNLPRSLFGLLQGFPFASMWVFREFGAPGPGDRMLLKSKGLFPLNYEFLYYMVSEP